MLDPNTLTFLKKLEKNNNKTWFDENRDMYLNAKADFEKQVQQVIQQFGEIDKDIAPLKPKDCTFRQFRDVRFSKDKTPYKNHMGASFELGGKKGGMSGYYWHVEPNNKSVVGGGIWMPEAEQLKKIRQEIDYNWEEFSDILNNKDFKKTYGDLSAGEFKLSREPKGYEKDNPAIEYLKLKSLVAMQPLTDKDILSKDILPTVISAFTALMPLVKFLNRSLE